MNQPPTPASPTFADLGIAADTLAVVNELGYHATTPIQAAAIPVLLEGRDLIGQAKTGSGKTVAFALPIVERVRVDSRALQAMILCPTRELCAQVAREIRKLGRRLPGLQVLILAGGQPLRPQLLALEKGVHIVVGTPGRVLDHLQRRTLDLRQLRCIVLDEADRMLDMGFEEDMQRIFAAVPRPRQTAFFSATFPPSIAAMSKKLQRDPVRITIMHEAAATVPAIREQLYESAPDAKLDLLQDLLARHQPAAALVFCNFKAKAGELAQSLSAAGVIAEALHGDLEQPERERVLAKFRNQSVRVLVATDVAARGIDVPDLDFVCNFDLPAKPDTYVHRIGRTGRAGKKGLAISLISRREEHKITQIEALTGRTIERPTWQRGSAVAAQPATPELAAAMATLYIAGGRKAKLRPGDILGALTGEAGGLAGTAIGKIEIHDHFAYVAVAKPLVQAALHSLRHGQIKGRKFQVELVR